MRGFAPIGIWVKTMMNLSLGKFEAIELGEPIPTLQRSLKSELWKQSYEFLKLISNYWF